MTRDELRAALANPNVQAFLRVIRAGETNQTPDAYRMLFGGGYFSSFADHPRQLISAADLTSSAAGAYQFLSKTWDGLLRKYNFPDFSPDCQDEAAVALIHGRKALNALIDGDLSAVLDRCSWEWASLPPSRYGQPIMDAGKVYALYAQFGGTLTSAASPAQPAPVPEKKMPAPFIGLALEALLSSVPSLIRHFGKGTRSEDNAKLAEVIVPLAKEAIGAANEQDLVERVMNDPEALKKVDTAIRENWLSISEAGGGGIEGAREANVEAAMIPPWKNQAIIIALAILPLIYYATIKTLGDPGSTAEIKTMVVSLIVGGALGSILGYFLGSSMSSRVKDEALLRK